MFPNIRRLQEQNPVQYQPSSITNKKLIVFCERTSGYIALPVWKLINLVYLLFYILFQCDSILPATLCYFHNISHSQLKMKSFMISIIFVEKVNTEFRQRKTAGIPLSSVIFLYARICCLIRFPYHNASYSMLSSLIKVQIRKIFFTLRVICKLFEFNKELFGLRNRCKV